ncbi:MAG: glutamine amidotransferase [Candidatus Limnocylindrus sp.]
MAATQVGKGRSLVWTSDIGPHWCPEPFVKWNGFAPLMSNMIDWVTGK